MKTTCILDQETTTTADPTDSLMDLDIGKLEQRQNKLMATLEKLRQENETMQHTLQTQFQSAMQALEFRMEQRTQSLVSFMGQTINQAVDHMNSQTARSDERLGTFLASFQAQADRMTAQIDRMTQSPDMATNALPDGTPVHRTKARLCDTQMEVPGVWEMDDDDSADGSRNSHASRASHPTFGMDATTGSGKKCVHCRPCHRIPCTRL
jgi:hypothetical protein